jgi:hypothetical protein
MDPKPRPEANWPESVSLDTQIVEMTGPGDTTIRPLTGKHLEAAKAERAKLEAWLKKKQQQQEPPQG